MTSTAANNAIVALATAIATDPIHDDYDWTAIALVTDRRPDAVTVSALSGYLYLADGEWTPSSTKLSVIKPPIADLVTAMKTDDEDPGWIKMLFQMQKPSGKTRVLFERDDQDRWKIHPSDWDALPEAIRPNFDD